MIKVMKKLIFCLTIMVLLSNTIVGNLTLTIYAAEGDEETEGDTLGLGDEFTSEDDDGIGENLASIMSGFVGFVAWMLRAPIIGAVTAVQAIGGSVAKMAGQKDGHTFIALTPDDIIFNKLLLTDINFFNTEGLDSDNPIKIIREQVGLWYSVVRTISILILLVVLLIVGIRMAITTVASEKAIYKKALVDWVTSLVLVFFLHYLISVIIWANEALVEMIGEASNSGTIKDILDSFKSLLFDANFIVGTGALLLYVMITFQTLMFLFSYIKRMLTLAFLIIISPLITITYAIDKMGDQKAQALNNWLKEFIYNVLIQPFHCILYLAFVTSAIQTIGGGEGNLASIILALMCMNFIWTGEKIVNKIFGFGQASSLVTAAASGAIVGSMIQKARSAGSNVKSGIKFASNSKTGQLLKQKMGANKGLGGLNRQGKKAYKAARASGADQATLDAIKNDNKNKTRLKKTSDKINNSTPITKMRAQGQKAKNKVNKAKDAISRSPVGTIYNKAKDSELLQAMGADAKKFVRKVARPENAAKVTAALMAGAAAYALPDSNLISAAGIGYAAGKSAETGVRNLRERKKENYEENVLKAWERHCDINKISPENRSKENFNTWYNNTYLKGNNMDAYSTKNMKKEEKDVSEKLEEKGLGAFEISRIIAEIQNAILSKNDYNPSEMFKDCYDKQGVNVVSPEDIAKIVQGYASKYNESTVYQNASAYDEQMRPLGISHEDAVGDISEKQIRGNSESIDDYRDFVTEEHLSDARSAASDSNNPREVYNQLASIIENDMRDIRSEVDRLTGDLKTNLGETQASSVISEIQSSMNSAINSSVTNIEGEIDRVIGRLNLGANEGTAKDFARSYIEQVKIQKEERFVEIIKERRVINKEMSKMM